MTLLYSDYLALGDVKVQNPVENKEEKPQNQQSI